MKHMLRLHICRLYGSSNDRFKYVQVPDQTSDSRKLYEVKFALKRFLFSKFLAFFLIFFI